MKLIKAVTCLACLIGFLFIITCILTLPISVSFTVIYAYEDDPVYTRAALCNVTDVTVYTYEKSVKYCKRILFVPQQQCNTGKKNLTEYVVKWNVSVDDKDTWATVITSDTYQNIDKLNNLLYEHAVLSTAVCYYEPSNRLNVSWDEDTSTDAYLIVMIITWVVFAFSITMLALVSCMGCFIAYSESKK